MHGYIVMDTKVAAKTTNRRNIHVVLAPLLKQKASSLLKNEIVTAVPSISQQITHGPGHVNIHVVGTRMMQRNPLISRLEKRPV